MSKQNKLNTVHRFIVFDTQDRVYWRGVMKPTATGGFSVRYDYPWSVGTKWTGFGLGWHKPKHELIRAVAEECFPENDRNRVSYIKCGSRPIAHFDKAFGWLDRESVRANADSKTTHDDDDNEGEEWKRSE
jgi:hypothetical protein